MSETIAGGTMPMKRHLSSMLRLVRNNLQSTGLGRSPLVRGVYDRMIKSLKDTTPDATFDVLGHRMYLDKNDNLNLSVVGRHEKYITELVQQKIQPGQIVVDIGANIGYYTLLFARSVGSGGHVYAFEPDPENFAILQKNIALNGYTNVTLEQKAVSDAPGVLKLYLAENVGDHRSYASGDGRECIEVPMIALDDYLSGKSVDFIKMDIQGFEFTALQGMKKLIAASPKAALITEFWPYGLGLAGSSARRYLEALQGLGLKLALMEGPSPIEGLSLDEIASRYDETKDEWSSDLFCTR